MDHCKPQLTWPGSFATILRISLDPLSTDMKGNIFSRQWAFTSTCKGDAAMIQFAMESFPSAHTASSFALGVFLALYLNAKLKAFSDYHCSFWKVAVVLAPIFGALAVASASLVDGVSSS